MALTFGSLFSGVGGFDLGLERAGMVCVWQVEIDKHAQAVLAKHWPDVPRKKDVRRVHAGKLVRPDWIVGGFPCQDLSVAGQRAGRAGKRSGLFFEFMRIVKEFAPGGVLIENVPGLLSSGERRDMGTVIGELGKLGYGVAWRVYDSQFFRVAQQRRRVFIVGCAGADVRRAAEILFESDCLPWHPAPSRETGARVAGSVTQRIDRGGVNSEGGDNHLISEGDGDDVRKSLEINASRNGRARQTSGSALLRNHEKNGPGGAIRESAFCASDYTTGSYRQTQTSSPLMIATHTYTHTQDLCFALTAKGGRFDPTNEALIPVHASGCGDANNLGVGKEGGPMHVLDSTGDAAIAFAISENADNGPQGKGWQEERAFTMEARHHTQVVAFSQNQRDELRELHVAGAVQAQPGMKQQTFINRSGVRRLTPLECCRLQAFPDDWLDGLRLSDSAKYRLLGNAVTVNVAEWIGRRIVQAAET